MNFNISGFFIIGPILIFGDLFAINNFIYTKTKEVKKTVLSRLKIKTIFLQIDKKVILIRLKIKNRIVIA